MATVDIIDVSKYYGQQQVLDTINFSIDKGEFLAVVGPSGCGKSTLLRAVAGLETIDSGQILINSQCVNKIPPAKRDMAMVFQSYALYPHMTVYDNMAYGLKMRGMKAPAIKERVHEVALLLQLSDYLQRKPHALSGGQRQRVAMGRAIVRSPSVFLFDEPLSNLDAKLRTEMRHEIKKLHQQLKTTCLYVTHDQTEAMTMASRILVLNKGRIEQIGTPQALYQQPASIFVAGFTGLYPINFLPGTINLTKRQIITDIGIHLPLPVLQATASCGEKIVVAIRAEHIKLAKHKQAGLTMKIDFIDDMGADKLIYTHSLCNQHRLSIRVSAAEPITGNMITLDITVGQANLFHHQTGLRLGGWHEELF